MSQLEKLKNQSKIITNQRPEKNQNEISFDFNGQVNLFVNWYKEINEQRYDEYFTCLSNNFLNSAIDKIYVLCENILPPNVDLYSKKFEFIEVLSRPTYKDIFEIVNSVTGEDDVNIISNTDIYFDDSIRYVEPTLDYKTVYCLTRWNQMENGEAVFHNKKDSQDVWIFRGKMKHFSGGNYTMGIAGCDNKIAHDFNTSGYKLLNPSLSVKAYHLHNTQIRNYKKDGVVHRLPPPYQFVTPSLLGNFRIKERKEKTKTNKAILHIALNTEYQKSLGKALSSLGDYFVIDWRNELKDGNLQSLYRKILTVVNEFDIDLIFMQIQTPDIIKIELIHHINIIKPNIKIINWNGDIRFETPKWMVELAKFNNIYTSFTNMRDVNYMLNLGYKNTFHMQISFEESVFQEHEPKRKNMPWIVFTGNNYGEKFPLTGLRTNVISKLKSKYGEKFQAYGNGWEHLGCSKTVSKQITNTIYRSAKIVLSINNINAEKYTSDRLFNALASKSFVLAHYYEGIEQDFDKGIHLDWWKDETELIEMVEYYLNNQAIRNKIAQAGMDKVWSEHRWINRIEIIKQQGILSEELQSV